MRIDIPERKKLTHRLIIPIRWGDMDAMGHVNDTIYFRCLEVIRIGRATSAAVDNLHRLQPARSSLMNWGKLFSFYRIVPGADEREVVPTSGEHGP